MHIIKKYKNKDISDKELEKIINPFFETYDEFIETYVMPEVIAYYIANLFYRKAIRKCTFTQYYNSAKDIINLFGENYKKVKILYAYMLPSKYNIEQ